jgi:lipopolysaccharide transport system permease protein
MTTDQITVYRPNMRHELGWITTWLVMAGNVWSARELIWQLFKRDFFAVYKKSFVGFAWVFLSPIVGIFSWMFLQTTGVLQPGDVGVPYPAFVLVGTSMWGLFMGLYHAAENTLNSGKELIMQVNYPHEALLFKQVAHQMANFVIVFIANMVMLLAMGVIPSWATVLLPLVALPLFLLAAAMGLVMSMINVVATDIQRIVSVGMGFLMYLTPVIYSSDVSNPLVRLVNRWNPLTYLVCSARDIILFGRLYDTQGYAITTALSVVAFLFAWRLFYVSEGKVVERMI